MAGCGIVLCLVSLVCSARSLVLRAGTAHIEALIDALAGIRCGQVIVIILVILAWAAALRDAVVACAVAGSARCMDLDDACNGCLRQHSAARRRARQACSGRHTSAVDARCGGALWPARLPSCTEPASAPLPLVSRLT